MNNPRDNSRVYDMLVRRLNHSGEWLVQNVGVGGMLVEITPVHTQGTDIGIVGQYTPHEHCFFLSLLWSQGVLFEGFFQPND